jgi:hypothetical protein
MSHSKLANLALLIGGYGVGQGSIFLVQTWLIATGRLDLVAFLGLHLTTATLGLIVVDAGSTTILARHVARIEEAQSGSDEVWLWYSSITVIRMAVASLIAGFLLLMSRSGAFPPATVHFAVASLPAFLIWAFNFTGILDGRRKSGLSGATAALPNLASVGALLLVSIADGVDIGYCVGAALSIGQLCAVLLQLAFVAASGQRPVLISPSRSDLWQAAVDGLAFLAATLPGQIYFRFQLQLCNAMLGTEATALFMYIKQIFVAIAQLIGFIRRIEFPNLVVNLTRDMRSPLTLMLTTQKTGTISALVLAIFLCSGGVIVYLGASEIFQRVGLMVALFSPVVVLNSFALALNQGLAAMGLFRAMMFSNILAILVGSLVCILSIKELGVFGLLLADASVDLVGIASISAMMTFGRQRRL